MLRQRMVGRTLQSSNNLRRQTIIAFLVSTLPPVFGFAQQPQAGTIGNLSRQERVIEKLSRKAAPIKIDTVQTKQGTVEIGKKFLGRDDWFEELTVGLTNTSGKTIIYISGGFLFPRPASQETEHLPPPLYHSFAFGRHPQAPEGNTSQLLTLKPGETMNVVLSDSDFNRIKGALRELNYPASGL